MLISGMSTACSPSRPIVPPKYVTRNKVPGCRPFTLVSVTIILRHGGHALAISEIKQHDQNLTHNGLRKC